FRDAGWPLLKRHVGAVVATAANPVMVGQPFDRRKSGLAGGSSVLLPRTVQKARVPGRPAFVGTRLPAWMPLRVLRNVIVIVYADPHAPLCLERLALQNSVGVDVSVNDLHCLVRQ